MASQLTIAPNISPSSGPTTSSVANRRFCSDSWTRLAFFNFFSKDGSACFLGGEGYAHRREGNEDGIERGGVPESGDMCALVVNLGKSGE